MGHEAPAFALQPQAEELAGAVVRNLLSAHPGGAAPSVDARLGLAELPERIDRLAAGMVYGLACDEQAIRVPLLAGALAASLRAGRSCVLLTPAAPRILLRKARLAGLALQPALKSGQLSVFQVARDAPEHLFRLGAAGLLAQLERLIVPREALVVIDEADALFMVCDLAAGAEAAHCYLDWASRRGHTLVALFAPAAQAPRDWLNLRRLAENFAGFGVARRSAEGGVLEIRHWFAAQGASGGERFELRWGLRAAALRSG